MKKQIFNTFIILLTFSGMLLSTSVQARLKCWTNSEGVRECGNAVPPEYAQQGHQELDKSGMVKKETERAKTDEELAPSEGKKYVRKRKGPLKGGTGTSGPGGLFGNPSNYS